MGLSEYAAGFEYVQNERGVSVTRVYHYDPDSSFGTETLPKLGDTFTPPSAMSGLPSSQNIICKSRSMRCLAGHSGKFEYTCIYNNEPVDTAIFTKEGFSSDVNDLPKTVEYSGEFLTINPEVADGWKWSDDSTINTPLSFRVNNSTLRIVRYVKDDMMQSYCSYIRTLSGQVNSTANPFGSNIGGAEMSWLFVGATAELVINSFDDFWWKVELEFVYRDPDFSGKDGWNKLMRPNGKWDIPKKTDDSKLYVDGNFGVLLV